MVDESSAPTGFIVTEVVRDVAVVRLHRPEVLNALNRAMRTELVQLIRGLDAREDIRGIVITGTGRTFSSGADLRTDRARTREEMHDAVEAFHEITRAILATSGPVVAAINGLAVGGAAELTLCCDARLGAPAAEFFMPENRIGLVISNGSSVLLRRLVGNHASRIVLAGPRVDADEAVRIGLIDQMVPADRLIAEAVDLVRQWTPEGGASAVHVKLLRPEIADVQAAITRETDASEAIWLAGIADGGIDRFWAGKASEPDGGPGLS
jgi:enoyl-CoA hydratase/carnithine racemase